MGVLLTFISQSLHVLYLIWPCPWQDARVHAACLQQEAQGVEDPQSRYHWEYDPHTHRVDVQDEEPGTAGGGEGEEGG